MIIQIFYCSNQDSIEMLRRFQSEPVLTNPRLESGNFKIKSDLRQSILCRHKQVTPMSDKRHPIRSTNPAQKQQPAGMISSIENQTKINFLVPVIPLLSFASQSAQIPPPEQLWLGFPRSIYGCYSTGKILIKKALSSKKKLI